MWVAGDPVLEPSPLLPRVCIGRKLQSDPGTLMWNVSQPRSNSHPHFNIFKCGSISWIDQKEGILIHPNYLPKNISNLHFHLGECMRVRCSFANTLICAVLVSTHYMSGKCYPFLICITLTTSELEGFLLLF